MKPCALLAVILVYLAAAWQINVAAMIDQWERANSRRLGNMRFIALALDGVAGICVAQGQAARAARLLGAAEALREMINTPIPQTWRADQEHDKAAALAALNEATFSSMWNEGRAMTPEQSMAYALADLEPLEPSRSC